MKFLDMGMLLLSIRQKKCTQTKIQHYPHSAPCETKLVQILSLELLMASTIQQAQVAACCKTFFHSYARQVFENKSTIEEKIG